MKKRIVLLAAFLLLLPLFAWTQLNYSSLSNWVICDKEKTETGFDVFYLYPTLSADSKRLVLDLNDAATVEKIRKFVQAQTGIFAGDARIFAPLVRQLEYDAILAYMKDRNDRDFRKGVLDAENAFRFYRRNFQNGRPFILLGHSQGAMELYELLKDDAAISLQNGFVAAYLIGLPQVSAAQISADFKNRFSPAKSAEDLAVIIVWNTQSPDAGKTMFTGNGEYCINPLNWRTDGTPAAAAENHGAFFYNYQDGSRRSVPHFCGARVNPAPGALIVDLPANSEYDAFGFMGKGVFHMNDIWFFAENIRENMLFRVKKYQEYKAPRK